MLDVKRQRLHVLRQATTFAAAVRPPAHELAQRAETASRCCAMSEFTLSIIYSTSAAEDDTDFICGCTSTDTAPTQVGVERFGATDGAPFNDTVVTSLSVAPAQR